MSERCSEARAERLRKEDLRIFVHRLDFYGRLDSGLRTMIVLEGHTSSPYPALGASLPQGEG